MKRILGFLILLVLVAGEATAQTPVRSVVLDSGAVPAAPSAGRVKIFSRGVNGLFYRLPGGAIVRIDTGSSGTGSGTVSDWGDIGGTISNQTDLWLWLHRIFGRDVDSVTVPPGPGKLLFVTSDGRIGFIDTAAVSSGGGGGASSWGAITGTLSNQVDLRDSLAARLRAVLLSGQIWVGSVGNIPTAVTPSGDVVMDVSGVFTIGTNKVTTSQMQQISTGYMLGRLTAGTGNVEILPIASTVRAQISATTPVVYTSSTGVISFSISFPLAIANGGTGGTTAATALANLMPGGGSVGQAVVVTALSPLTFGYTNLGTGDITGVSLTFPSSTFSPSTFSTAAGDVSFNIPFSNQTANYHFVGPASGAASTPTWRLAVWNDISSTGVRDTIRKEMRDSSISWPSPAAGARYVLAAKGPDTVIVLYLGSGLSLGTSLDSLVNTIYGTNLGSTGEAIYSSRSANLLQFKRIAQGTGITVADNGNYLTIASTGASSDSLIHKYINSTGLRTVRYQALIFDSTANQWILGQVLPNDTTRNSIAKGDTTYKAYLTADGKVGWAKDMTGAGIGGSGTANFVPIFTASGTIGNSRLVQVTGGLELRDAIYSFMRMINTGLPDTLEWGEDETGEWYFKDAVNGKVLLSQKVSRADTNSWLPTWADVLVALAAKVSGADTASWLPTWADINAKGYGVGTGDIEGVTVQAPLTGGATSGTATVGADTTTPSGLATLYQVRKHSKWDAGVPIDSSAFVTYGTRLIVPLVKVGEDSIKVDSLNVVMPYRAVGDTVTVRIVWGMTAETATDSLPDLKCYHGLAGISAGQTKVIPPNSWVSLKIIECDGATKKLNVTLEGYRKWY